MNKRTIALILIIILVSAIPSYYLYEKTTESEVLVSSSEVDVEVEDGEVKGYWYFNLVVNERDEIEFVIQDQSEEIEADEEEGIPEGSEVRTGTKMSVILSPNGPPYMTGPVSKRGLIYDDFGHSRPTTGDGTKRIIEYYALGHPEWHDAGLYAPYDIRVKKSGITKHSGTYISGSGSLAEPDDIELDDGIEIEQVGQLINGINPPQEKYAYVMIDPGGGEQPYPKFVGLDELEDTLLEGYHNTGDMGAGPWQDVIDKWDEVTYGADVDGGNWVPSPKDIDDRINIGKNFVEGVYLPPGEIERWNEEANRIYSEDVPEYYGNKSRGSFEEELTDYTAVRALPDESLNANLVLKVPAEFVDTWVYKPASGKPNILDVYHPEAVEGQGNVISVDVRNDGETGDTFWGEIDIDGVVQESPGGVYIPEGETKSMQWVVSKSVSDSDDYEVPYTITVGSKNTDATDSISGDWGWTSSGDTGDGYGGISGKVVNSDQEPIEGANVSAGGRMDVTAPNGTFTVQDIGAGSQTLSIDATGYESKDMDVNVLTGDTVNVGNIILYEHGEKDGIDSWMWVTIAIVSVLIIFGSYYYIKKRGGEH